MMMHAFLQSVDTWSILVIWLISSSISFFVMGKSCLNPATAEQTAPAAIMLGVYSTKRISIKINENIP